MLLLRLSDRVQPLLTLCQVGLHLRVRDALECCLYFVCFLSCALLRAHAIVLLQFDPLLCCFQGERLLCCCALEVG